MSADHRRSYSCSLLLLLHDLGSNAVHIGGSLLGEALAHDDGGAFLRLVVSGTNETGGLELVESVADVLSGGEGVVLSLGSSAGSATVVLAEGLDTNLLVDVDLVGDGSGAGVEPVVVKGCEVLVVGSLNVLGPLLNIIKITLGLKKLTRWTLVIRRSVLVLKALERGPLTSGILILLPFFRCLANTSMNSLAGTSFTVFP